MQKEETFLLHIKSFLDPASEILYFLNVFTCKRFY